MLQLRRYGNRREKKKGRADETGQGELETSEIDQVDSLQLQFILPSAV